MKNNDQQCFKWCITRACNPVEIHSERMTKILEKQAEKLDWEGVNFPASFSDINRFEKNNNMSIVVLGYDTEDGVSILRVPKENNEKTVILLLIKDKDGNKHYCLDNSLSRLLASQVSKGKRKRYFCHYCLNGFNTETSLMNHMEYCSIHDCVKTEYPKKEKNDVLKFNNRGRMHKVPFIIYVDFECFTKPLNAEVSNANAASQQDPNKSYTNQYQKHEPSGFCYYVKCFDDSLYDQDPVHYSKKSDDDNVAQIFVNSLDETVKKIYEKFKEPKKMIFTDEDKENYEKSTHYYVCEKYLGNIKIYNEKKGKYIDTGRPDKVRNYCHFTGKYRGAAHNKCNLKLKTPKFIPVIFHNLEGYDSHLFIKNFGVTEGDINCIPKNEEKYISFTKHVVVETIKKEEKEDKEEEEEEEEELEESEESDEEFEKNG